MTDEIQIQFCHRCFGAYEKFLKFPVCPYCGVITKWRLAADRKNARAQEKREASRGEGK